MYTLFLCSCINRIILLKGKKYYIEMCENDFHKCKWFCALYYMSHCFLVNTKVTTPSTKMNFTNPEHYYWTTTMFNVKISVQKKSRLLNFPIIHNLYNWVCKHIIVINIKSQRASPLFRNHHSFCIRFVLTDVTFIWKKPKFTLTLYQLSFVSIITGQHCMEVNS